MTNAKIKVALVISAAIMLASGSTTVVLSSDKAGDDLSSSQIFQKAQANYASLKSYSDEGQIVATMNDTTVTTRFTIRLARPGYYLIEWGQTIESSYSTTKTQAQAVWSLGEGSFLEMGNGPQDEETRNSALAKAAEISGGAAGTIPRTFFNMQWGDPLGGSVFSENRQPDEKVGIVNCYVFSELFPRVGFIVTNLSRPAKRVVRFYNQRGTAEQWIKEGKNAVKWTRLSCHDFVDNQVRLQLFVLAYNLGNFPAAGGAAQSGASLDVDDAAGETDQDRGEGRAPFPEDRLPDGGGGGAARVVPAAIEGNCMKTMETTEVVSSRGMEKCAARRKCQRSLPPRSAGGRPPTLCLRAPIPAWLARARYP
jgi:hypothetical protein